MSNIDKQGRQVQRYANFGVDMMEWDDGGYVKHSDYVSLLDEMKAKEEQRANWFQMAQKLGEDLDAAEKRIAELSASHGKLREAMAGIHNTITAGGAYTPLAAILNASKRAYEESAAAAGKGE